MGKAGPGSWSKRRPVPGIECLDLEHRVLLIPSPLIRQGRIEVALENTAPVVPLEERMLADERGQCRGPGGIEGETAP